MQRDRIVDDPHRRELLPGFRLTHDHRPLPMQIDPDKLPPVIIVHRGLPLWCVEREHPSIRRERHDERTPRPFIASTGCRKPNLRAVIFIAHDEIAAVDATKPGETTPLETRVLRREMRRAARRHCL